MMQIVWPEPKYQSLDNNLKKGRIVLIKNVLQTDPPSTFADAARDEDISTLFRITLDENEVTHDTSGTTISPSGTL